MSAVKISVLVSMFNPLIAEVGLAEVLSRLAAAGFDGVEMGIKSDQDHEEVLALVRANGLELVNMGISLDGPVPQVGIFGVMHRALPPDQLRDAVRRTFRLAATVGAKKVQYCCMNTPERDETWYQFRDRLLERLTALAQVGAEEGVVLAFEPMSADKAAIVTTTREGIDYVEQVGSPGIAMTLDSYHIAAAGEDLTETLRVARPYLAHFHTSDFRKCLYGFERPMPGRGTLDFGAMLATLVEIGYTGYVGIEGRFETDDPFRELRDSVAYLRSVAP